MFHRIGAAAYKDNLDNINALAEVLNHPERKIKTVHVAGTNGKGSVSSMLASVFQESGYKTGLFTSPHLKDFRERIKVDGNMIDEDSVISFVENHKQTFEDIQPSFFEWTTALAFDFFARCNTDIAIIETGLGGRLDSTNIIFPELSIITNISFDHKNLLGDTLEKIASEKAGIIKKGIPVIIGERQKEIENVFIKRAKEMETEIVFATDTYWAEALSVSMTGQHFQIYKNGNQLSGLLFSDLAGNYQINNICTVLEAADYLKKLFPLINDQAIHAGLSRVKINTGLKGRWEVLKEKPLVIADVAHNEAGIKFVIHQLSSLPFEKLHIVLGMVNDKDIVSLLKSFPDYAQYYFCKADIPRALDADVLQAEASQFNLMGDVYDSVEKARQAAEKNAGKNDIVFIGGSTFVVAEVI